MARPRKITTEVMLEIVDSYYLTKSDGNERLMKCSLIARYAAELGYTVKGYDFARNMEVREYIERLKVCAETSTEVYGVKYNPTPAYKTLDVEGFLYSNSGDKRLASALRDLDGYWKRVFEYAQHAEKHNRALMKEKAAYEAALKEVNLRIDTMNEDNLSLSGQISKLTIENRYLRKMLRQYLYPAVADEILKNENDPPQTDTQATDAAICDFIEDSIPKSFEASVSKDDRMQADAEKLMSQLWEQCDE